MHTKEPDSFYFWSYERKNITAILKKPGTYKYYHYIGVKTGIGRTQRGKKKSSLYFCLCCQPTVVKMIR